MNKSKISRLRRLLRQNLSKGFNCLDCEVVTEGLPPVIGNNKCKKEDKPCKKILDYVEAMIDIEAFAPLDEILSNENYNPKYRLVENAKRREDGIVLSTEYSKIER